MRAELAVPAAPRHARMGWMGAVPHWAITAGLAGVIALFAVLIYTPVLPLQPLLDDDAIALGNKAVTQGQPHGFVAPYSGDDYFRPLWRPLATLTLRADWLRAAGQGESSASLQAAAHQAMVRTNLALFALAAALALLLLVKLGLSWWVGLLAAALLVLHPVNSESIWRLAGRAELLAYVFLFGALIVYVSFISPPRRTETVTRRAGPARVAAWGGVTLIFLAGLLSHEAALLLPVLILGYEASAGSLAHADLPRARILSVAVACGILILLWAAVRGGVLRGLPHDLRVNPMFDYVQALDFGERLRLALFLPWLYAGMLLGIATILPDYTHLLSRGEAAPPVVLGDPGTFGVASPGTGQALLGVLVLAAGVALFVAFRKRLPAAAFGCWVFVTTLLAVLPLIRPNGSVASARHLYLPLFGLGLMLASAAALGARTLLSKARAEWLAGVLTGMLIIMPVFFAGWMAVRARAHVAGWTASGELFARLAREAPDSPVPPFHQAGAALAAGDIERAAALYEKSIGFFPRNPIALLNLGLLRAQQANHSLAGRILHDAAVVASVVAPRTRTGANAHLGLATLLGLQDRNEDALRELYAALDADSLNVHALARAGLLECERFGTAREGIRKITRALEVDREAGELGPLAGKLREIRAATLNSLGLPDEETGGRGTEGGIPVDGGPDARKDAGTPEPPGK